jgi:aminopeptidase N
MDEGMATFSEYFLPREHTQPAFDQAYLGSQNVLPMMTPSHIYSGSGINSYTIGGHSYHALYQLLGKDLFLKCMKAYMDTWQRKHPTPYDFMYTFNRVSGMDLSWFWNKWYFDWGYIDIGISGFTNNELTVENKGGRPIPFSIQVTYSDSTTTKEEVSPAVWKESTVYKKKIEASKPVLSIDLLTTNGDASFKNNKWKKE